MHVSINRAVEGNYFAGSRIAIGRGEDLAISHLLYVDDTLIFCQPNIEQLKYLSWILMWFEALSGLKINLKKAKSYQLEQWIMWRSWLQS